MVGDMSVVVEKIKESIKDQKRPVSESLFHLYRTQFFFTLAGNQLRTSLLRKAKKAAMIALPIR